MPTTSLPECCLAYVGDPMAKQLYARYNAGGERPGLNYQDKPCPLWDDLPRDVQRKWEAVAEAIEQDLRRQVSELRSEVDALARRARP